jgi:hypothetical protein
MAFDSNTGAARFLPVKRGLTGIRRSPDPPDGR